MTEQTQRFQRPSILMVIFWLLFLVSTFLLMFVAPQEPQPTSSFPLWLRLIISPFMLLVQWGILLGFRAPLTKAMRSITVPPLLKYIVAGLFLATVVGNNFAINFDLNGNDFHPDPLVNITLYSGPYGAVLLALYLLRKWYRFTYNYVFWITGMSGALIEQNFLLPLTLLAGDPFAGAILLCHVIPAYGVPFGSIWIVMPVEQLPGGTRRLGIGGILLCSISVLLCYYIGAFIWFSLFDLLFGTGLLSAA